MASVARPSSWLLIPSPLLLFIPHEICLLSLFPFPASALRRVIHFILFPFFSLHFFVLLAEDQRLEPQERALLLLQHTDQIEQRSQEPGDHSLILLAQCVPPDFFDQGLDFGRIDCWNLVVRFSHSYHTSILRGTITGRFSTMFGSELLRFILFALVLEVTHCCRSFTLYTMRAAEIFQ